MVHSVVLRLHVVCLSVTLVLQDHIGWKYWELTLLFVAQIPSN